MHAPVNGSQAVQDPTPDTDFTFNIAKAGADPQSAEEFFSVEEPEVERWNFTYFEGRSFDPVHSHFLNEIGNSNSLGIDLFAKAAEEPSLVNVAAKAYRNLVLTEPGEYVAKLTYNDGETTEANWSVRDITTEQKAKNVILFIGDGMTTSMITGRSMSIY